MLLRTIFRTAMNPAKVIGSQCSEPHYAACKTIGEEGIVLLKNEKNILPIQPGRYRRILVVGENADRSLTKGGGSSELKTLRDISPLESLRRLYGDKLDYAQGYTSGRAIYDEVDKVDPKENERLREEALQKAKQADLIIFIGGLNKNCKQDCENADRESYDLSFGQNELITALAKLQKNIVAAVHHPRNLAPAQGAGTHQAGLDGDIERALGEVLAAQVGLGRGDGLHLGMGGDVGECLGQVVAAGYHVALAHNHGPYGHLIVPHGFLGLLQGQAHVFLVVAEV